MRGRFTVIEFPVFCNYTLHVEIASDLRKAMMKYPATEGALDKCRDTEACCVHLDDASHTFMFLKPNVSAGTIAHESYHAARRILKYMGCEIDNESVAYHLGYIVQHIHKFLRRGRHK